MSTPAPLAPRPSALLLALDTATDRPTLALGTPDAPGPDAVIPHRHDLSREIDRVARRLLDGARLHAAQLGGVIVADGPGSFTGLRIGVAFAKGLCRAAGVPLLTAPSLLGAARAVAAEGLVIAEYDALRGDVFRAAYRFAPGAVEVVSAPSLQRAGDPPDVAEAWRRAGVLDASAAALLSLAGRPGGPAPVEDAASWEPSYGRLAEAEARRLAHG